MECAYTISIAPLLVPSGHVTDILSFWTPGLPDLPIHRLEAQRQIAADTKKRAARAAALEARRKEVDEAKVRASLTSVARQRGSGAAAWEMDQAALPASPSEMKPRTAVGHPNANPLGAMGVAEFPTKAVSSV